MKETILLVEDSEEDVFFFKRALRKSELAIELILASDGKKAVSILSDPLVAQKLAVVFLDLKMPHFSGFDVLRWVQTQNFGFSLRIIVLSGSSESKDRKLAQALGAFDYVVKPITKEVLLEHLSVAVGV